MRAVDQISDRDVTRSAADATPSPSPSPRAVASLTGDMKWWAAAFAVAMLILVMLPPPVPPLFTQGITAAQDGGVLGVPPTLAVPEGSGIGADRQLTEPFLPQFAPGTSLLQPQLRTKTDKSVPVNEAAAAESRAWLAAGQVPGQTPEQRAMAERALLDLRLLTRPNGAVVAGWRGIWRYVWPRDTAFVVAAFAATGHPEEAERALRYLVDFVPSDGRWQARYRIDGSGRPAPGDRGVQLDGSGWVPWAVWFWYEMAPDDDASEASLEDLWPLVERSADGAVAALDRNGLPEASPDYWEHRRETLPSLGTAAPLLAGLNSAADLARRTSRLDQAAEWESAACELAAAIGRTYARQDYSRYPDGGGYDAAVTFLVPPLQPRNAEITAAVRRSADALTLGNGGVRPGEKWRDKRVAWTPEVGLFTLSAAASGDRARATAWLDWLEAHTTRLGSLPEKVSPDGRPVSVAPLAWTASLVLLAQTSLNSPLPVPPASCPVPTGG